MEKIFVDTSALFALVNTSDEKHILAWDMWNEFLMQDAKLITNNYVMVESIALIQNRLGIQVVRQFNINIASLLQILWIDEEQHIAITDRLFSANRRQLSHVDCSSFETMRRLKIEKAFTFDKHFREQGFDVIP